jgi:hypothetical protein
MDGDLGILPGTTSQVDPSSAWPIAGDTGVSIGTGTGQHGTSPGGGISISGAFETIWQWLNKPFTTNMSPVSIMLLVGVVLISILLWNLILYHIRIAAESI